MTEHASEIISLLLWMIGATGALLFALIVWVGKRLTAQVDALPAMVQGRIAEVYKEVIERIEQIAKTHRQLEKDLRSTLTDLDRRVVALEVRCDLNHWPGRKDS